MTTPDEPLTTTISPDGYMLMTLSGGLSNDVAEPLRVSVRVATQMTKNYFSESGRKPRILFDMTTFTGEYSVATLEIMIEFAKETKPYVYRTACFGGPVIGQAAGEMVAALSGRDNIHFFKTRDEALAWLMEPAPNS